MSVRELYPGNKRHSLKGLYLKLALHRIAAARNVYIYANYIVSLDGRISLPMGTDAMQRVPDSLANARDWRLYQELAAQSEVLITSARYFRQLAQGCAQDVLPLGDPARFADLQEWRAAQGLRAQPDVLILSNSLNIPPDALPCDRRVLVACGRDAPEAAAARLRGEGVALYRCPQGKVDGGFVRQLLITHGYRSAYMIAGPEVHRTLLEAGVLDECFLTLRHMLLGGRSYATCLEGPLAQPVAMELVSLYLDDDIDPAQQFARFRLRKHG